MQISGERMIEADRATVWAALNDPEVLKACIPGCREMKRDSETSFTAKVSQKIGPVRASFTGELELSDIEPLESYRLDGRGKGGVAGGAAGGASVRLEDRPEGTLLSYEVDASVTGKLAQLGNRLIDGFAKKFADDFFDRFKAEVEGEGETEGEAHAPSEGPVNGTEIDDETGVQGTQESAGGWGEKVREKKGILGRLLG